MKWAVNWTSLNRYTLATCKYQTGFQNVGTERGHRCQKLWIGPYRGSKKQYLTTNEDESSAKINI